MVLFWNDSPDSMPEKGNPNSLRVRNTAKILEVLRRQQGFSRAGVAECTNLDKKTVTNIVNELLDKNVLTVNSRQAGGVGRPKEILGINGDYAIYAGIDLGGTHLSGVIVNFTGGQTAAYDLDVNGDMEPNTLMKLCDYLMNMLLKNAGIGIESLSGIGISFPGFVSKSAEGGVTSENLPLWSNIPIQKILEAKYGVPVELVDPFPLCIVDETYHYLITPCKCGLTDMSINGSGDVTRCGADPNYQLGNILVDSTENMVLSLWQNSSELINFRTKQFLPEQCQICPLKVKCGGGCAIRCNLFRALDKNHLDIFDDEQETLVC